MGGARLAGPTSGARLVGVELYFDDLEAARRFYRDVLGLELADEMAGRFARLETGNAFVCLERRGGEPYPSADKAVVFLEVPDLERAVTSIGRERFVRYEPGMHGAGSWAVLHDPEGHNVVLLPARTSDPRPTPGPERAGGADPAG